MRPDDVGAADVCFFAAGVGSFFFAMVAPGGGALGTGMGFIAAADDLADFFFASPLASA